MASSLCKSIVLKVYQEIMDDVVAGLRELFHEDGVDEQILQELKQSWETKLLATKAVDTQSEIDKQIAMVKKEVTSNGQVFNHKNHPQHLHQQHQQAQAAHGSAGVQHHTQQLRPGIAPPTAPRPAATNASTTLPPTTTIAASHAHPAHHPVPLPKQEPADTIAHLTAHHATDSAKLVPIQITLPQQPGNDGPRVLTIQVPVSALQGNQLHKVLTGPVITATMGLPHAIASTLLQQHVNAAFNQHHPPPTAVTAIAAAAAAAAASAAAGSGGVAAHVTGNGMSHAPPAAASTTTATTTTSAQNNVSTVKSLAQGDATHDDSDDDDANLPSPSNSGNFGNNVATSNNLRPLKIRYYNRRRNKDARTRSQAEAVLAGVLGDLSMNPFIIEQYDGNLMDTSDEDEEPSDEEEASDEDYDNKDEEDQEMEDAGPEEEPLNSEDDVTDEDPSELFDTDNVIVCQYDKVTVKKIKGKESLKNISLRLFSFLAAEVFAYLLSMCTTKHRNIKRIQLLSQILYVHV